MRDRKDTLEVRLQKIELKMSADTHLPILTVKIELESNLRVKNGEKNWDN